MKGWLFRDTPGRLRRALFRLPVYLYRFDLGRLLGHRFLMVTHRGRKTGLPRQAVLEVIRYDPETRESIVVAALGERADWYRNIQAAPPLMVQTGHLCYVPEYRVLTAGEAYETLTRFERDHPLETRVAIWLMGWEHDGTEAARRQLAHNIRLVAFRPG